MRLERVDVLTHRGAVRGVRGAVEAWTERAGLLLRLVTSDGRVGQGEASPLPRYSADGLDAARSSLEALEWNAIPQAESGESIRAYVARLGVLTAALPPSAAFAVETALLDLVGQERDCPLWALFGGSTPAPVPLSSLVGGADDDDAPNAAAKSVGRGIGTVKVKIAGPHLGRQLGTLARIREAIGDGKLRLDANGTFASSTAFAEIETLAGLDVEFVEEPMAIEALLELQTLPIPIALDESLQPSGMFERLEPFLTRLGCAALVLKPAALGGFSRCLELAERGRFRSVEPTVSHLFDGPVALAAASHLALAVASRSLASGLDWHGGLSAWPEVALPFLRPAEIVPPSSPGLGLAPLPGRP